MAAAPKKNEQALEIAPIDVRLLDVFIVGDEPLICHAWSEKAKREMLDKQTKKAKGAREAKDPEQDFRDSLYPLGDGEYGFPSVAFKNAAVTAVTAVADLTKVAARQAFQIVGRNVLVPGAWKGVLVRQNLVRIEGSEPAMREDMVRVGMGTADLRYRAEFFPWRAWLTVRYDAGLLSAEQVLSLVNRSGFSVGVGEWRPEKDGPYGTFHVAGEAEIAEFAGGRP